eukprot:gene2684-3329_t
MTTSTVESSNKTITTTTTTASTVVLSSTSSSMKTMTKIKVRTADGRVYEERLEESSNELVCEYKGIDEKTLIKNYSTITNLNPFYYCKTLKQWIKESLPSESKGTTPPTTAATIVTSKNLKFITFNVWFDSFLWKERAKHLFEIIRMKSPDVVCLQEVTPLFLEYLCQQRWVIDDYYLSDCSGPDTTDTVYPYGVIMMVNRSSFKSIDSMTLYPLPCTSQSRKMINLKLRLMDNHLISVSTVHLESLDYNSDIRIKQLNYIFKNISNNYNSNNNSLIKYSFLMGDFNFGSNAIENQMIELANFNDLWKVL